MQYVYDNGKSYMFQHLNFIDLSGIFSLYLLIVHEHMRMEQPT